jgi:hypothetical protein
MTIKEEILKACSIDWKPAGLLEDYIRGKYGNKASCASRRMRELVEEGKLEKRLNQVNGRGVKFVEYRLAPNTPFIASLRAEVQAERMQQKLKWKN